MSGLPEVKRGTFPAGKTFAGGGKGPNQKIQKNDMGCAKQGAFAGAFAAGSAAAVSPKDRTELSEPWAEQDWETLVKKTAASLQEQYPGINFVFDDGQERNTRDLAVYLGAGAHLVISKKFLERMASGKRDFEACSRALASAAKRVAAQAEKMTAAGGYLRETSANFWTVKKDAGNQNMGEPAGGGAPWTEKNASDWRKKQFGAISGQPDAESAGKRAGKKAVVSCSYRVSEYFRKVAAARSKGQVRTAMGDIYKVIADLRVMAAVGGIGSEDQVKAKRALRSLEKLLSRGRRKISRLNREEQVARREKKARERMEKRKAEQARLELKRRRSGRAGLDHALVKEGMQDEAYVCGYRQYRRFKNPYAEEKAIAMGTVPADLAGCEVPGGAFDAAFSASDVAVSESVSF